MNEVLVSIAAARAAVQTLKTADRSEQQRRLAILGTELEKVAAFAEYVANGPKD